MSTELVNFLSIGLGILGVVLAILFYLKSKNKKLPLYEIRSYNIISNKIEDYKNYLEVSYKNKKVDNLTISKIVIWNSGNTTILKEDIPKSNNFSILLNENSKIFDFSVIYNDDIDRALNLKKKNKKILIDFNYLEPKTGFILKLIHSGENSNSIVISGKVIGGSFIERINDLDSNSNEINNNITSLLSFVFGCLLIFQTFYFFVDSFTFILSIFGSFIPGVIIVLMSIMRLLQKKIPKKLKSKFEKE